MFAQPHARLWSIEMYIKQGSRTPVNPDRDIRKYLMNLTMLLGHVIVKTRDVGTQPANYIAVIVKLVDYHG